MIDLYAVLGLEKTATPHEIRSAYRTLALKHHPDRNGGSQESEQTFREINGAYQVLSDEHKRRAYDMERRRPVPPPPGQHAAATQATSQDVDAFIQKRRGEAVRNSWFYKEGQRKRARQNGQRSSMGSGLTVDPFEEFRGGLIAPIELGVPLRIVAPPSPLGHGIQIVQGQFGTLPGFFMKKKPGEE